MEGVVARMCWYKASSMVSESACAGVRAHLHPPEVASLVGTRLKRGQPLWSLCGGRDQVHIQAFP